MVAQSPLAARRAAGGSPSSSTCPFCPCLPVPRLGLIVVTDPAAVSLLCAVPTGTTPVVASLRGRGEDPLGIGALRPGIFTV